MRDEVRNILSRPDTAVLFTGVGNVLRSDDGAGVYIVSNLKPGKNVSLLLAEASIENYISKINAMAPDILVITDCIDFNREPGFYDIVPVSRIHEFEISSHNISLRRVSEYLKMKVFVIGVQPADLRVGEYMTPPVKAAADEIIALLNATISEFRP